MTKTKSQYNVGRHFRATALSSLLLTHLLPAVQVDSEIVLLVDVTGSVSRREHNAMMESIARSFESPSVINSVSSGAFGKVAASLVFWSSQNRQAVGVSWMEVSDAASAAQFASLVRGAVRPFSGSSAIGSALAYAAASFGTETGGVSNGFESTRQAITLFGDGIDNNTPPRGTRVQNVRNARDSAIASGVDEISAVVLTSSRRDLESYYSANVIGSSGPGAATVTMVEQDEASQPALEASIARIVAGGEVISVPEPSSLLFLGLSTLLLLKRNRR